MEYKCRFCGSVLTKVFIDLGHQPPSNAFIRSGQEDLPETYYPLKVYACDCGLVQMPNYVNSENLFTDDYPYYSSQSPANVSHAKELVSWMMDRFHPGSVLEIGSNDGYLLQHFPSWVKVLGIEPSAGPATAARKNRILTITEFFNTQTVQKLDLKHRCDIICSVNVLAHQPNLHDFIEGISFALKLNGVTIHEFPRCMLFPTD